jgi:hypothetical protein
LSNWLTFSVPRGVLGLPENKSKQHPRNGWSFTCQFECWWGTYHFKNTHSPITLADISFINLVYIFRFSSSPINPVYTDICESCRFIFSQVESGQHPHHAWSFTDQFESWWQTHRF